MTKKDKYGTFLTIVLVLATLGVVLLIGIWGYNKYKEHDLLVSAEEAIEEFDNQFEKNDINEISVVLEDIDTGEEEISDEQDEVTTSNNTNKSTNKTNKKSKTKSSTGTTTTKKTTKKLYKGYVMAGYIEIPRTKVKLPLLESVSPGALDKSVAILMTPGLNKPGNTTIVGHNYRNRTMFSRNGELEVGDLVFITDETGNRIQYTIYNTYLAEPDDSSYMTRDTAGEIEISLSTCTNDNSKRIIVWAKAD